MRRQMLKLQRRRRQQKHRRNRRKVAAVAAELAKKDADDAEVRARAAMLRRILQEGANGQDDSSKQRRTEAEAVLYVSKRGFKLVQRSGELVLVGEARRT